MAVAYNLELEKPEGKMAGQKIIMGAVILGLVMALAALIMSIVVLMKSNNPAPPPPTHAGNVMSSAPPAAMTSTAAAMASTQSSTTSGGAQWYANQLQSSMNMSANPCTNFYNYACGSWIKNRPLPANNNNARIISFSILNKQIIQQIIKAFNTSSTQYASSRSITQATIAYKQCVNATNVNFVGNEVLGTFQIFGGMPLLKGSSWAAAPKMTPDYALGVFASKLGVQSFISWSIDTDWRNDQNQMLWFSQPTLSLPNIYYTTPAVWAATRPLLLNYGVQTLSALATLSNSNTSASQINATVSTFLDIEFDVAAQSVPASMLRNFTQQYNVFTRAQLIAKWGNVNWNDFFLGLGGHVFNQTVTQVGIMEPKVFDQLNSQKPRQQLGFTFNYLMWRYATNMASEFIKTPHIMSALADLMEVVKPDDDVRTATSRQMSCASVVRNNFMYPVSRLYADQWKMSNPNGRNQVGGMVSTILNAFASQMVPSLSWMDQKTKVQALWKANQLVQNIAYPDWIMNTATLDAAYPASIINNKPTESYYQIYLSMIFMGTNLQFVQLFSPTNRKNFLGAPAVVNAWYQPELNSITFPAGILNPPFYKSDFPMAVNYGGMGVVMGHELSHGFDDEGVQWNYNGTLMDWMDTSSYNGFINNVAKCIQTEYSGFCYNNMSPPLNPNCVNGVRTQGENIADNGGIKAAYNAYHQYTKLMGGNTATPPLPAPMNNLSGDQVFFLSFAQVWCEHTAPGKLQQQLLTDPHSPGKWRVQGTVQNFPAFGKAFNCPAGSPLYNSKHCNIW